MTSERRELTEEERRILVDYLLSSPENALEIHRRAPRLVEEALRDVRLSNKVREDPALFARLVLGFKPTWYQEELLRCESKRIVVRWPRQSGKTRALAAYALWFASTHPKTTTIIAGPCGRQSIIVRDFIHEFLDAMPPRVRRVLIDRAMRTTIYFRHGSRIVALPNSEHRLRGYTAHLIIVDEASFFPNDETIFLNILLPMLATTDGTMILSSTAWGKNTLFYALNMEEGWTKLHITWRDAVKAGVYKEEFVRAIESLRRKRPDIYRTEFEVEFIDEVDAWLSQDLLARACDAELEYHPFDSSPRGLFYIGVDLGERVDHSVVAVLDKKPDRLNLVHMHRFPLRTRLAAVIGYVKTLRDRWSSVARVYVDKTKHGDYIIEDFREAGVREAEGINLTQKTKQEMAQILKQRMQEGTLRIPYDRQLLDELNAEKYQLTKTGHITLTHPDDTHDDRFWALALATYATERETKRKIIIAKK
jgi:phage FluMu gp28-like protein